MPDERAVCERLSAAGRHAVRARRWGQVDACGRELLRHGGADAEGYFLLGLAAKGRKQSDLAMHELARATALDRGRYDAAVELAGLYLARGAHGEAVYRLRACEAELDGSPYYLDMAATLYARAGLPADAWRLYRRANELQPGVDALEAKLAAACVHVGRRAEARSIYRALLERHPTHQRNHYELSRLATAKDRTHIDQMLAVLDQRGLPPTENIYLYYALGKEYEDLGDWDEAFRYYRLGGDAAAEVAGYDVGDDLAVIDTLIRLCTPDWLRAGPTPVSHGKTPIFVVGLPRSGTTLVERMLSAHSRVGSAGESFFVAAAIAEHGGGHPARPPGPEALARAAAAAPAALAEQYLAAVDYRLGHEPFFVEKLPENFLYLGFLARAFPDARFVLVRRQPMDACFALYKQSYFRYAYRLADLGRYYPAYRRLMAHWDAVLGERLVTVDYETLVAAPGPQARRLLESFGLPFEAACLAPENNPSATNSASAAQVREPVHTRSVGRWRHFERQLEPLAATLCAAGIEIQNGA